MGDFSIAIRSSRMRSEFRKGKMYMSNRIISIHMHRNTTQQYNSAFDRKHICGNNHIHFSF